MANIYDYLFYKLYRVNYEIDESNAGFISAMLIVYFLFFNILSAFSYYYVDHPETSVNEITGGIVMIILIGFNLMYFNHRRTELIYNRYKGESPTANMIGTSLVLLYVILSIYLCFWVAIPFLSDFVRQRQ